MLNREQAEQILIEYCKGKGSMYHEKWIGLVQIAYDKGETRGYRFGMVFAGLAALVAFAITTFPF
jgi:hypothetical protein